MRYHGKRYRVALKRLDEEVNQDKSSLSGLIALSESLDALDKSITPDLTSEGYLTLEITTNLSEHIQLGFMRNINNGKELLQRVTTIDSKYVTYYFTETRLIRLFSLLLSEYEYELTTMKELAEDELSGIKHELSQIMEHKKAATEG